MPSGQGLFGGQTQFRKTISLSRSTKYIFSHFGWIIRVLIFLLRKFEKRARIEIGKEIEGETRKEEKDFVSVARNY